MEPAGAKHFIISKVIEQSEIDHVTLSDVEKKMLQFTETQPTFPDIYEVNSQFERDYDTDEYEAKVAALLKNARDRDQKASPASGQRWVDALESLRNEDHYILVMAGQAFGWNVVSAAYKRSKLLTYVVIAIGVILLIVLKHLTR